MNDARQTLADFLTREIGTRPGREWAAENKLQEIDVRRARKGATGMSLDKLQTFANALRVEPWQLLFPGFTRGASEFPTMSNEAIGIALELDKIADPNRRREVYATLMRVVETVRTPAAAPVPQAEPPKPSPETMRPPGRDK